MNFKEYIWSGNVPTNSAKPRSGAVLQQADKLSQPAATAKPPQVSQGAAIKLKQINKNSPIYHMLNQGAALVYLMSLSKRSHLYKSMLNSKIENMLKGRSLVIDVIPQDGDYVMFAFVDLMLDDDGAELWNDVQDMNPKIAIEPGGYRPRQDSLLFGGTFTNMNDLKNTMENLRQKLATA